MRAAKTNAIPTRASLIGRLKNWDDQKSWDEFNRTYRQFIVGFAVKQGLREPEAEDVAQETLLAVARSIGGFNYDSARSSFKNWLLTVARHRITDYVRRRPNEVELQPGTPEDSTRTSTEARSADPDRPALELIEAGESERAMMEEALERLKTEVSTEHFRITADSPLFGDAVTQPVAAAGCLTRRSEPACRRIGSPGRRPTFPRVR